MTLIVLFNEKSQYDKYSLNIIYIFQGNISNYDIVMESDMGTFTPQGLQFSGYL